MKYCLVIIAFMPLVAGARAGEVPNEVMKKVYEEVKTPLNTGWWSCLPTKQIKVDCPSIFRKGSQCGT
mgnify:CR=1 FL=1